MADGSARFLSKDIDPQVMERLATLRGGEPADMAALEPQPGTVPIFMAGGQKNGTVPLDPAQPLVPPAANPKPPVIVPKLPEVVKPKPCRSTRG